MTSKVSSNGERYTDNPDDATAATTKINDDDDMPARLRRQQQKMTMGEEQGVEMVPSSGMEMMPLAQNSDSEMEYFDDEDEPGTLYGGGLEDDDGHPFHQQPRSETLPDWLEDFLFPPSLPRSCQLLRPENIAVPACYLLVGLLLGLSSPLINAYPLDLGATEAQQTSISAIRSLPASFKLIFGFLSDSTPLFGYRRKSYMLLGWVVCSASYFALILGSNLSMELGPSGCNAKSQLDQADAIVPDDAPSMAYLSLCALCAGMGLWFSDVMGDSIVAEKAKLEPPDQRGSIQSSCYSYRFFGSMIAVPMGTYLYSSVGPFSVVLLLALLPLSIIPFILRLEETKDVAVAPIKEQCQEIYNTVCSRAVWQPLGFVYLYNILQVGNSAWKQFLRTNLGFSACQLNMLLITAYILLYMGVLTYKYYMINWSWRTVYITTTLLNGVFSGLQVLLILGITFGLSPFLFAFGDDVFSDFLAGVQFLPTTILMVHLCPAGSEGASYAMFTTVNNSALALATAFSTMLLSIWDVSKEALENNDLQGLINLTVLTTSIQVSGVFFVFLLPAYKEDLERLRQTKLGTSHVGGTIFLLITLGSIAYAISVGLLNIVLPGWMDES